MPVSVCKFESCSGHDQKRDLEKRSLFCFIPLIIKNFPSLPHRNFPPPHPAGNSLPEAPYHLHAGNSPSESPLHLPAGNSLPEAPNHLHAGNSQEVSTATPLSDA